ncbi:mitochondrial porin-like protein [Bimuria novae-zelandiae CBS 107.79]|uniref:Mitochondrial porin-like protein n=1 Tax=Bimuria novae-zelandiae CBS 107.79 TaxID=1447943 RepID=A0A6A5V641_9PLEO|nr:mitochondrial porin-like protein [Bimuria novae-zelandiae CBS 107.79]
MADAYVAQKIAAILPPPAFSDIAKSSNDLINKDFYHAAAAQLEVKLKAPNGVNFTAKGTSAHDGPVSSSLEGKKSISNGISITQSWNTANLLSTKVELNDTLASGLKTEILNNFKPDAGNQGQKVNLFFKQNNLHARVFGDLKNSGSVSALADVVLSHEGFLVGGEIGYDVQKAAITRYSAAVGYTTPIYNAAITATNSLSVFSAAYYQKVNTSVEFGTRATWDSKSQGALGLELAAKYKIDALSFAKAKINNLGIASLAYNTKVNNGLTFGVGGSFDTQKLNESGHKLGTSFTFEG